jgi:hypothetical protein
VLSAKSSELSPYKPMSLFMKAILWFVVANAYAGAISLIVSPVNTNNTFFWKITPPIGAVMYGAMYAVAGTIVLLAVLRGRWESARFLTAMVPAFTGLMLLNTVLHSDKFVPDFRFYYWLAVYIVAPLAAIFFFFQHERGGANWQVVSRPVTPLVRWVAVAAGVLFAAVVVTGYISPSLMAPIWPWEITPLMVRVFMAWASALGAGLLWFAVERDWDRVKPVANMLVAGGVILLVVLALYNGDLKHNATNTLIFTVVLAAGGLLGAFMHWQQRAAQVADRQHALRERLT